MDNKQVRYLHQMLDRLAEGKNLSPEEIALLRKELPELPIQKTLEEIHKYVDDAWLKADDPELKEWLHELHAQLKGLEVAATIAPALPAGMRLADHEQYGRVVVSPGLNDFGLYLIFVLDSDYKEGAHWHCEHGRTLTFVDAEPAKPAHPEFLETEADYENAPEGTVVARDGLNPWVKEESVWVQGSAADSAVYTVPCLKGPRRILRWGDK